jgi:hypothetical protein
MFYVDSSGSDNDEDLTGETSFDEPPHCRYYSESFHDYDMPALCHGGESLVVSVCHLYSLHS